MKLSYEIETYIEDAIWQTKLVNNVVILVMWLFLRTYPGLQIKRFTKFITSKLQTRSRTSEINSKKSRDLNYAVISRPYLSRAKPINTGFAVWGLSSKRTFYIFKFVHVFTVHICFFHFIHLQVQKFFLLGEVTAIRNL